MIIVEPWTMWIDKNFRSRCNEPSYIAITCAGKSYTFFDVTQLLIYAKKMTLSAFWDVDLPMISMVFLYFLLSLIFIKFYST